MSADQIVNWMAAMIWFGFACFNIGGKVYKNIYVKSPDTLIFTSILFAIMAAVYVLKAVHP